MTSPWAPPRATVADRLPDERRGSSLLAIVAGVGVDLALTELGLFLYGWVTAVPALTAALAAVPDVDEAAALVIGLAATAAGGVATAWVANRRELLHGVAFGIATLAVAEAMMLVPALMPETEPPAWRQLAWLVLAVPAAAAGAWLRRSRKRRDAALEAAALGATAPGTRDRPVGGPG